MSSLDNFFKKYKLNMPESIDLNDTLNIIYYANIDNIRSCIDKLKNAIDSLSNEVKGRYKKKIYKKLFISPGSLQKLIDDLIMKNKEDDEKNRVKDNIINLNNNNDLLYLNNLCDYNSDTYQKLVKDRRVFKLGSKTILKDNIKYGLPHLLGGISNGIKMFNNAIFKEYFQSFDYLKDGHNKNNKDIDKYLIYSIIKEKDIGNFIALLKKLDEIPDIPINIIRNFKSSTKRKLRNDINSLHHGTGGFDEQDGGFSKIDSLFVGNKTDKNITQSESNKKKRFKLRKKIVRKNYRMMKKIYLFFFQFIIIKLFYFTGELTKKFKDRTELNEFKWNDSTSGTSSGTSSISSTTDEITLGKIFSKDSDPKVLGIALLKHIFYKPAPTSAPTP